MTRDKFTFYGSWWGAVGHLSGELRGEVLTAIVEYGLYGETNSARGSVTKAILELVKPQIDRERNLYENGCRGAEYRALGGRPRKPQENPKETPSEPQEKGNKTPEKPQENPKETPVFSRTRVSHSLNISPDDINNQDNNLEIEKIEKGSAEGKGKRTAAEREQELAGKEETLRGMVRAYSDRYPESMLEAFVSYWTEPNKSRTRLRYELEKTWDTGRRLVTWANRDRIYAPRQPAIQQEDVYAANERMRRESRERIARKYGTDGKEVQA